MPFDAEVSVRAAALLDIDMPVAERDPAGPDATLTAALVFAPDPDLDWAAAHPDRLLAYLYVSPRPCAALDALIEGDR